jgi:hypothetical protein
VKEEKQSNVSLSAQQRISFGPPPEIPPREDIPSQQSKSDYDTDEDGSLKRKSTSTIEKIIPRQQPRVTSLPQSDEDEDSGISRQKLLPAEKKKKKAQQKTFESNKDDDDDGVPKQRESSKKKKSKKDISKSDTLQDEEENGGPIIKRSDTAKKIVSTKQPLPDNRIKEHESSSDDGAMRSSKQQQDIPSASYDTINRIVPKTSDTTRNTKLHKTENTVPTDEEHAVALYSPPSYNVATNPTDLNLLRTISYRTAQQYTPPLILHRSDIPVTLKRHNNTNDDDDSHYSEITNDTIRSGVSNRIYSKPTKVQTSSSHSNKQQIEENDDTSVDNDEEDDHEKIQLLHLQPTSLPNELAASSTKTSAEIEAEKKAEKNRIQRRKQLRFRWHFLYTILRNYHLFDLRKEVQGRLARLHLQRSTLVDEQQFLTTIPVEQPQPITPESRTGLETGG